MQILLPMAKNNQLFKGSHHNYYPSCLIEIMDKPIISYVVDNFDKIKENKKYIFIINSHDAKKFHLTNSLRLLNDSEKQIIVLENDTAGSACSCLMAIDHINRENPLIIANSDQIFDINLNDVIDFFKNETADSGLITFDSIHPRWSYALIEESNRVVQTAEKNPISRDAIAGFYYFKKAEYFLDGAMKTIEKDSSISGEYFVSPVINELILKGKKIISYKIKNTALHSFYSPEKIKEYKHKVFYEN